MNSYYEKNKDKILARKKKYDQENKDKISQYNASYYKQNKKKISARKKELYQKRKKTYVLDGSELKIAEHKEVFNALNKFKKNLTT